jgi:hypothetical protein
MLAALGLVDGSSRAAPPSHATPPRSAGTVASARRPIPSGPDCHFEWTVGEDVLQRLVSRPRVDAGPVEDVVLDAFVVGRQETVAHTRLDLRPCDRGWRIDVVVTALGFSETIGTTTQARVATVGRFDSRLVKPVLFDGYRCRSAPAACVTVPCQQHVAASTPLDGIPLIGPFAGREAYRVAESRRPLTEAIAADRVARRLESRADGDLDPQIGRVERRLSEEVYPLLDRFRLRPVLQAFRSTDEALWHQAWFAAAPPSGAPFAGSPPSAPRDGLRLRIHQDALGHLVRFDGPAEPRFTDRTLRGGLRRVRELLSGRSSNGGRPAPVEPVPNDASAPRFEAGPQFAPPRDAPGDRSADPPSDAPELYALAFPREDVVRAVFADDEMRFAVRFVVDPVVGNRLPPMRAEIGLAWRRAADGWTPELSRIEVTADDPARTNGAQTMLIRESLRQRLKDSLAGARIPARFATDTPWGPAAFEVTRFDLRDGWLEVELRVRAS